MLRFFHGGNRGSNPRGDAKQQSHRMSGGFFVWLSCGCSRTPRFDQRSDQWEECAGRPQGGPSQREG